MRGGICNKPANGRDCIEGERCGITASIREKRGFIVAEAFEIGFVQYMLTTQRRLVSTFYTIRGSPIQLTHPCRLPLSSPSPSSPTRLSMCLFHPGALLIIVPNIHTRHHRYPAMPLMPHGLTEECGLAPIAFFILLFLLWTARMRIFSFTMGLSEGCRNISACERLERLLRYPQQLWIGAGHEIGQGCTGRAQDDLHVTVRLTEEF